MRKGGRLKDARVRIVGCGLRRGGKVRGLRGWEE
jgi:hypothetical protein